jgi:hypothetical protein
MEAQNKATLEKFPDNVAALTMKLRVILQHPEDDGCELSDVNNTVEKLDSMENEQPVSLQIARCEGEVAFAFLYIGSTFYGEVVDRYGKLLDRYKDRITQEVLSQQISEEFMTTLCSWHFYLAKTYNQMLKVITFSLVTLSNVFNALL